jgi:hypothetical protein
VTKKKSFIESVSGAREETGGDKGAITAKRHLHLRTAVAKTQCDSDGGCTFLLPWVNRQRTDIIRINQLLVSSARGVC